MTGKTGWPFSMLLHQLSITTALIWMFAGTNRAMTSLAGGTGKDYINCPMDEEQYNRFIDALLDSETADFKEWETDTPISMVACPLR